MADKKTKETETKIEREYIIPLREKSRPVPRYKKTPKAVKTIKEFIARHMKVENRDLNKVKISKDLNQFLWAKGIRKHPHKIKVKAIKKGEEVQVELVNYPNNLKFKKLREEKVTKAALESIENKKSMMQRMKENLQQKPAEEKAEEEKKEEAAEKEKTSAEATQQFEKEQAKQSKHQTEKPAKAVKPFRQALQK